MKTLLISILLSLLISSCESSFDLPSTANINAKYIAFDNEISSRIIENLDSVKQFNTRNDKQEFKLNDKVFKVETKFNLYPDGTLFELIQHKYYSFKYSDFGLKKDSLNSETIGINFLIKFSASRKEIIDCGDTLKIENVYPKEKLIFVEEDSDDTRVTIYEYK